MLGYRWVSWGKNVQRRGREENQSQARRLGDYLVEKERDPSIWKDQEGGRRHLREATEFESCAHTQGSFKRSARELLAWKILPRRLYCPLGAPSV